VGYGLDEQAIEAIRKWRFHPGMKDGNPVPVTVQVEVMFRMGDGGRWHSGPMAFSLEAGVTPPVVKDGVTPPTVQAPGDESVVLDFTVDSSGSVKNMHAIHGSKSASELLSHSLARWKFQPAMKGNQPVEATGRVLFVNGEGDEAAKLPLSPPVAQGNPPKPGTASAGVILSPLDPATVDDTYASNSGAPALLDFVNRSGRAVDIYWIDYQGNRQLLSAGLPVGANWLERTFLTHPWLVVVSGTGGTTAQDTGIRLAGFVAVTPNPSADPAKKDVAIITGRELLRQAANRGDLQAMVELGEANMEDHAGEAAQWFRKAADAGNQSGMLHLGGMYELGSGVRQDYGMAAWWYRKAAGAGSADAMYNLGRMYENGQGVPKDPQQAYKLYLQASGLGNAEAKAKLARLNGNQK
jgi:hypothetical protein